MKTRLSRVALGALSAAGLIGLSGVVALVPATPASAASYTFDKETQIDDNGNLTVTLNLPSQDLFESQVNRFQVTINGVPDGFTLKVGAQQSPETKCSFGSACVLSLNGDFDGDTFFEINLDASVKANEGSTTAFESFKDSGTVRSFHPTTQLPPPSLFSSNVGLTSFTVNVSKGSNATAFFYRVGTSPGAPNTQCGGTQYNGSSITITNRDFATTYYVWVCVTNSAESYKYSASEWELLLVTTKSPNPSINGATAGDNQVVVSWSAAVGSFTVQYRVSGNSSWTTAATGLSEKSYTVDGLDNGRLYDFRVIATVTGYGSSDGDYESGTETRRPQRELTVVNLSVLDPVVDPGVTPTTKVYDGTTTLKDDETFTGALVGSKVVSDDGTSSFELSLDGVDPISGAIDSGDGLPDGDGDLEFTWKLVYEDENVGQNKGVQFQLLEISDGGDELEWDLDGNPKSSDSSLAEITQRPLTLSSFEVVDKVYDGGVDADNGGDNPFSDDRLLGDELSFDWTAEFSDKNVAAGKTVSVTGISISGGADQNNYDLVTTSGTTTAEITALDLTLSNFSAEDKIYDGTTDVPAGTFDDDRLAGDELEFDFTAAFAADDVKDSETVTFSGISISGGADQGNYNLLTTSGTGTANIIERPVHLDGIRVYDATRLIEAADLAIIDREVADTGLIGEETLVVGGAGWIETKDVGISLSVEKDAATEDDPVEGATGLTLADGTNGGLASNYTLVGGEHTVTITQAPMTIEGMEGVERIYDGTTLVELEGGNLVGVFEGDVVSMSNNEEGEADSPDVGSHDVTTEITLAGVDGPNYLLTQPVPEVEITTRELTVSGLRVVPKTYDGSSLATLTGATLNNVAPAGSVVSLTGATTGTFSSPNAGIQPVAFTLGLAGANASNYTLVQPGALSGTIEPAAAQIRFVSGLVWIEGIPGQPRVVTIPAGLSTEVSYPQGSVPESPGQYQVQATITDPNYEAPAATATLTVLATSSEEGVVGTPSIGPVLLSQILGLGGEGGEGSTSAAGTEFGGLEPGELVIIRGDGLVESASVNAVSDSAVRIDGGDFAIDLQAEDDAEQPRQLNADGRVELEQGTWVRVTGSGFAPGEKAEAWLFSDPRFLGAVDVDASGNFSARLPVPEDIEQGVHTIQLNALDSEGELKSASLGVEVVLAQPAQPGNAVGSGEQDGDGGGLFGINLASATSWLLGWTLFILVILGGAWWWFLLARRRRRDREEVYVPEEFTIDSRVDSEYRR